VTVKLSLEVEARIRERVAAGAAGSVQAFVESLLRRELDMVDETPSRDAEKTAADREQEVDDFFAALDALRPDDLPYLPDDALRRETLYEGVD